MMENKEKLLIEEICLLFEQLKETEKGKIISSGYILPPDNYTYTRIAENLIGKAFELSQINSKYDVSGLPSVLNKEIQRVSLHKFEYHPNGKIKSKSENELKQLMRDATYHIKLYFSEVLGGIEL